MKKRKTPWYKQSQRGKEFGCETLRLWHVLNRQPLSTSRYQINKLLRDGIISRKGHDSYVLNITGVG